MDRHMSLGIVMGVIFGLIAGYIAFTVVENGMPGTSYCLNGTADTVISPGADAKILAVMNSAEKSIHITLFEFSYSDLKEALIAAANRGVDVKLILDPKVDQNLDTAAFLKSKGIAVRWSSPKFNYTHAKTAIIDGKSILTGSINWSRNAMKNNREIGVIIENERMAQDLEAVFESDWDAGSDVK